jgi:hippurate hydrolase
MEPRIRRIADGACRSYGADMELRYERRYPLTLNAAVETKFAATAAAAIVGEGNVRRDMLPSMGAEDFAFFLEKKPGAYIWIGNGTAEGGGMLHSPHYDFNDAILPLGASYWVRLAEAVLARDSASARSL